MTMTAQETADSLAEMTGAFARRRDAILAVILAERKAAVAEAAEAGKRAAREMNEHSVGTVVERAILALFPEGKGPDDWLPIETAPKDGTRILVADDQEVSVGHWTKNGHQGVKGGFFWRRVTQPTHWKPLTLPSPPTDHTPEEET